MKKINKKLKLLLIAFALGGFNYLGAQCPAITCPSDITVSNDAGNCDAVVTYTTPVGTNPCGANNILFVSDNAGGTEIPAALTTAGHTVTAVYSDYTTGNNATLQGTLSTYSTIFWHASGSTGSGESHNAATFTNLNSFVASGGDVFVTGYDVIASPTDAALITFLGGTTSADVGHVNGVIVGSNSLTNGYSNIVGMTILNPLFSDQDNLTGTLAPGVSVVLPGSSGAEWSLYSTGAGEIAWVSSGQSGTTAMPLWTTIGSGYHEALLNFANTTTTTLTTGLSSGSSFLVGLTTVTYTVTDHLDSTASCSFTVTVNDTEDPSISCPGNVTQNNDLGICGAVVNYTTPVGTDNCSGSITNQTAGLASGATFPVGTTTNTFVVTDASGNKDSCSFAVTITDNEDPQISCPANMTVDTDPGVCNAVVTYTAPVGTDNCPGATTVQTAGLASGATFPKGITTNTFEVTDAVGKKASCSFTVTVEDNEDPVITCPANITVNNNPGICGAVVNYTAPVGSDNCGVLGIVQTSGLGSGATFPIGTTTETYTITDLSSNTSFCSFIVTVIDAEDPVITCPPSDTVFTDPGLCSAIYTFTDPIGTDNCPASITTQIAGLVSGSAFPKGATTVTFEVVDQSANAVTCSFIITVIDNENPQITCPGNITQDTDPGLCSAVVTYTPPVGTDNCPGQTTYQIAGEVSGYAYPKGVTTNTFVVVDAVGLTDTCSFTITVEDNEDPVISCPGNYIVDTDPGICGTLINYTTPVGTDNCPNPITTQTAGMPTGSTFPKGVTTNTFLVTDQSGNTDVCSFTVTVNDNEDPQISCPGNMTVDTDPGMCSAVVTFTAPVGTDNCPGQTTTQTAGNVSGYAYPKGVTTNTYLVTDAEGNTATCSFTITVEDNEDPQISCPADIVVDNNTGFCGAFVSYSTPVGTDNCPNANTVRTSGLASGWLFPIGTTTNTYVVTDQSGNTAECSFTVTVNDNEDPVLNCPLDMVVSNDLGLCEAVVNFATPVGTDNCPSSVTIQTEGMVSGDSYPKGTTTNSYLVTDASGNTATCSFTITVIDDEDPKIDCPANITVDNDPGVCGAVVTYTPPVGTDNCPGAVTGLNSGLGSGALYPIGTTTETYTVVDAEGFTATCSFTVTVEDNEYPVITCPSDITVNNDLGTCGAVVTYTAPVGTDQCSGHTTVQTVGLVSGSTFPFGETVNTFAVTDTAGNVTTCSFTVTVNDNEAPEISCPEDITVYSDPATCGALVTYTTPVGTDNCTAATNQIEGLASGSMFPIGLTVNTFMVVDHVGYESECSFTVTVVDNENPALTCPANIVVNNDPGICGAVIDYTTPVGTDNCPNPVTVQLEGLGSGATFPIGVTTESYEATDASGNVTSCSFTITVNDTEDPVADELFLPNVNAECTTTLTPPTATDNCDETVTATTNDPLYYDVAGTYTVTWIYEDQYGNSSTQDQTLILTDDQSAPTPDVDPLPDVTADCEVTVTTIPTATDECVGAVTGTTTDPLTYDTQGTYTITWTYDDGNGFTSTQTQTVIIDDVTPPTFTCPADLVTCNGSVSSIALTNVSDLCSTPTVTYALSGATTETGTGDASSETFNAGVTTVTYTVSDEEGNSANCSFEVNYEVINTSVTQTGNMLEASANGFSYQWVNCNNQYAPVSGETGQEFTPTENGSYAVIITGNCVDTSDCYTITTIGIEAIDFDSQISVYPNPVDDIINIEIKGNQSQVDVVITNVNGQEALRAKYTDKQSIEVDVEHLLPNVYFMKVKTSEGTKIIKMVKK